MNSDNIIYWLGRFSLGFIMSKKQERLRTELLIRRWNHKDIQIEKSNFFKHLNHWPNNDDDNMIFMQKTVSLTLNSELSMYNIKAVACWAKQLKIGEIVE